jgi:hypothetical protein
VLLRAWANFSDCGFSRRVFLFRQEFSFSQSFRFFPSFCQALAEDRVTTPTKKKKKKYTLTPLLNLDIPLHKVHQLTTKLHCHAIKSLNKIIKTRHKIHHGGSGRGVTGRAAGFRRARRRPERMADNPPDPH